MFLQKVGEGFVRKLLKRGHPVAAKLHQGLISLIVEFDDLAHLPHPVAVTAGIQVFVKQTVPPIRAAVMLARASRLLVM